MEHFTTTYRNNFSWDKHLIHKKESMKENFNRSSKRKSNLSMKDLLSHGDLNPQGRNKEQLKFPNQQPSSVTNGFGSDFRINNGVPNNVSFNSATSFAHKTIPSHEQFMNSWTYQQMPQNSGYNLVNNGSQMGQQQYGMRTDDGDKKFPSVHTNTSKVREKEKRIGMKEVMCHIENLDTTLKSQQHRNNNVHQYNNVQSKYGSRVEKLPSKKITMKDILYNSEPKPDPRYCHRTHTKKSRVSSTSQANSGWCGGGSRRGGTNNFRSTMNNTNSQATKEICGFCGKEREIRSHIMGMSGSFPAQGVVMESNVPYMKNMNNLSPPYCNFQK